MNETDKTPSPKADSGVPPPNAATPATKASSPDPSKTIPPEAEATAASEVSGRSVAGTSETPAEVAPSESQTAWLPEGIGDENEHRQGEIAIDEEGERLSEAARTDAPPAQEAAEAATPDAHLAEQGAAKPDAQALAAELDQQRDRLVAELFGTEHRRSTRTEELLQAYVAAADSSAAAGAAVSDEAAKLSQRISEVHESQLISERSAFEQSLSQAKSQIAVYDSLFAELDGLVEVVASELGRLDGQDQRFQKAPPELQAGLLNFRKGVEIIHRMFARAKDRKKNIAQEEPTPPNTWQPPALPEQPAKLKDFVARLCQAFHAVRDANYHANQDAKKFVDKCCRAAVTAVAGLLPAVDGIDGGLENEPESKAKLAACGTPDATGVELIESWLKSYHNLDAAVNEFFAKIGVEAHVVKPGTRFDPETMEPRGTVANPAMNDEDVAAMVRPGYSLKGTPVRPPLVDVVKNK